MTNNSSSLKVSTPLGSFESTLEDENYEIKFSAYGIVDVSAAFKEPDFEKPDTIKSKGLSAGQKDIPDSDATSLSSDELNITSSAHDLIRSGNQIMSKNLSGFREDMVYLESRLSTPKDLNQVINNSMAVVTNIQLGFQQKLRQAYEKFTERKRELNYFKGQNNIERSAKPREGFDKVLMTLVVILCIETLINGMAFREVVEQGMLGGWILAGFISIVNVSIGMMIGYFLCRHFKSSKGQWKVIHGFGIIVFSLLDIGLLLFVSHFRDQIGNEFTIAENGSIILSQISYFESLSKGLDFNNFESLAFFLFSVAIFIWALVKGYSIKDAIPNYSEVTEEYIKARDDYQKVKDSVYDEIKNVMNQNKRKLYKMQNNYREWLHAYQEIPKIVEHHIQLFQDWIKNVNRGVEYSLKSYREHNVSVRTSKAPGYFSDYPVFDGGMKFEPIKVDSETIIKYEKQLKQMEQQTNELMSNFDSKLKEVTSKFDLYIEEVESGVKEKMLEDHRSSISFYNDIRSENSKLNHG